MATAAPVGSAVPSDCQLLVGAEAFWTRAAADIAAARRRVLVQAMTFEGDAAGQAVAASLRASAAVDRRVLVDDYSRVVVSDCFVHSPRYLLDRAFREEVLATRSMSRLLLANGVRVRTTNPIGWRLPRYAIRNHKKLIVADDVAYVGGFNFSDHNFAWHDLMLRIEKPDAADFLADDFDATWESRSRLRSACFGGLTLAALDGRTNEQGFADVFSAIAAAERRIEIVSPYLSFPFIAPLADAASRGVEVDVLTPLPNNKPLVRNAMIEAARRGGIGITLLPAMTHLKAMLVDRRLLVLGSSNFDFPSYLSMEEYLVLAEDAALVAAFVAQVLEPLRAAALPGPPRPAPNWQLLRGSVVLGLGRLIARRMGRLPRSAIDWR
jgi:cardiolipin synthase